MDLDFDFGSVVLTEFGVGRDDDCGRSFVAVPVDAAVQDALRDVALATWDAIQRAEGEPAKYDPSEKHGTIECLYLPLADDLAESVRDLHEATTLDIDAASMAKPSDVFCYFCRLTDKKKRRLTALRRATQFKGVIKSKDRLVRMLDDTLKIVEDTVFKLDNDFDLLVDAANVHILRPSGFEFAGKLQQAILSAVPKNIKAIGKDLPFVEFSDIEAYAGKHPRAARYLASIRGQADMKSIDKILLKRLCKQTGVVVREAKGKVSVSTGSELGFLEVLDRRRYEISLIKQKPERYRAASRKQISD